MSDFLTNLLGRSLGALEVVQPRVPSIYEPHRRGSGLLATRPGAHAREASAEPAAQTAQVSENSAIPISPTLQRANILGAHNTQSPENHANSDPTEGPNHLDPQQRLSSSLSPDLSSRPEAITANHVPSRHDPESGSKAIPSLHTTAFVPTFPAAIAGLGESKLTSFLPGGEGAEPPQDVSFVGELQGGIKLGNLPPTPSPGLNTERGDRRTAAARGTFEPALVNHAVHPPAPLDAAQRFQQAQHAPKIPSAIRPPLPRRSGDARGPAPSDSSSLSSSTIQVSIGRVEVRAVFPESSVRRAPVPRSRPSVSLDDYLNQPHRGKR